MADTLTQEISPNEIDPRRLKQYENAKKNLRRNPGITVDICKSILSKHPGCYEVRKTLHDAFSAMKAGKTGGLAKFVNSVSRAPFAMKGSSQVKKDPNAAIETAEKMIAADPTATAGYKLLSEAAAALGMWNTAILALEGFREIDPTNLEANLALGNALVENDNAKEAIVIGDAISRDHPGNEDAADLIRRASVAITMERGKYDKAGSFRDSLADEARSAELEQAARVVKDEGSQIEAIDRLSKELAENPDDVNRYRAIINACRAIDRIDEAISWAEKARQTPNGKNDPTLERTYFDLKEKSKQAHISDLEEQLEAKPDDTQLQAELDAARAELLGLQVNNAKYFVERYPNDFAAHFRYGELLLESDNLDEAIREFQLAQRNPQVRVRAILLTGRAMLRKGMADLAITQLELAKADSPVMNELKKEIIYDLGSAHEAAGHIEAAMDEFKTLYQSDISYKDVADKINAFYASKK